jgi:hypothetical protein
VKSVFLPTSEEPVQRGPSNPKVFVTLMVAIPRVPSVGATSGLGLISLINPGTAPFSGRDMLFHRTTLHPSVTFILRNSSPEQSQDPRLILEAVKCAVRCPGSPETRDIFRVQPNAGGSIISSRRCALRYGFLSSPPLKSYCVTDRL